MINCLLRSKWATIFILAAVASLSFFSYRRSHKGENPFIGSDKVGLHAYCKDCRSLLNITTPEDGAKTVILESGLCLKCKKSGTISMRFKCDCGYISEVDITNKEIGQKEGFFSLFSKCSKCGKENLNISGSFQIEE